MPRSALRLKDDSQPGGMKYRVSLLALSVILTTACSEKSPGTTAQDRTDEQGTPLFADAAASAGLDFVHTPGASGAYYFPEIVGAGGALLDYDNDGDLDVYLIQSGVLGAAANSSEQTGNRLFQNELHPSGKLSFVDVTDEAGVGDTGYGMGVTVGDIDNDGDADLYVTNFGDNILYRNNGDGSFEDVTAQSGADDPRWSTSAAFIDVDHDGNLDLFVATYADYSIESDTGCRDTAGRRDYCAPAQYPPTPDTLFRNLGDSTFTDISDDAGIAGSLGPGLGVIGTDFDGDGLTDVFVANDQTANFLWRNQGGGVFRESGLMTGVAFNADGKAEASMGVTAGDFDGDGDDDLFMTHLTTESNTLYVNDGRGGFTDETMKSGLGSASVRLTGFGSRWFDYDNDGDLDVFIANGAVFIENEQLGKSDYPYAQPDQLFENVGDGEFRDVSAAAGFDSMTPLVSRGAAFGDIDNDGDIDILVTSNNGPPRLLLNNLDVSDSFLRIRLTGVSANADAQGARVALILEDDTQLWRRVHIDGSFASASDKTVHFGLRPGTRMKGIGVIWPGGNREWWPGEISGSTIELRESSGQAWSMP